MELSHVELEGPNVRLEPLDLSRHWDGLLAIGLEPELWRYTAARIHNAEDLDLYLRRALQERDQMMSAPFAIHHLPSGRIAGCTRFGNIEPLHKRVEIGWTWVGKPFQRTIVNTETKYLLFRHAFETWGWNRVELKTSSVNHKSKASMRRLGLVEEGTLRRHMVNEDGTLRDTVYFSVIREEWPEMKARLEGLLAR